MANLLNVVFDDLGYVSLRFLRDANKLEAQEFLSIALQGLGIYNEKGDFPEPCFNPEELRRKSVEKLRQRFLGEK